MSTVRNNKRHTAETEIVEKALKTQFSDVEAYRYNSASIRVRIIDERFNNKSLTTREKMVLPIIRQLPEETQADITVLLLIPPEEATVSMMNTEFEHPSPSLTL